MIALKYEKEIHPYYCACPLYCFSDDSFKHSFSPALPLGLENNSFNNWPIVINHYQKGDIGYWEDYKIFKPLSG